MLSYSCKVKRRRSHDDLFIGSFLKYGIRCVLDASIVILYDATDVNYLLFLSVVGVVFGSSPFDPEAFDCSLPPRSAHSCDGSKIGSIDKNAQSSKLLLVVKQEWSPSLFKPIDYSLCVALPPIILDLCCAHAGIEDRSPSSAKAHAHKNA
jgi:hypothetical protein